MGVIKERVRDLRKKQTPAEQYFWNEVRSNKLGFSFRRQYPIVFYIGDIRRLFVADFFCKEKKLVIEIDGKIHENKKEYDESRTFIINDLGYTVMRFSNEQILSNFKECANAIMTPLAYAALPASAEKAQFKINNSPSPCNGEGARGWSQKS